LAVIPLFIWRCREWYEEWAVLRSDEAGIITDLLLSLNALDANLDFRSSDLNEECKKRTMRCRTNDLPPHSSRGSPCPMHYEWHSRAL
jgi:hypothetical protein